MAYKQNKSPLHQSMIGGMLNNVMNAASQPQSVAAGYVNNNTTNTQANPYFFDPILSGSTPPVQNFFDPILSGNTPANSIVRRQSPISPTAMSNQGTIASMFGQVIPGTYNRNVAKGPLMQMTSQGYVPPMDPTNPSMGPDVNALITGNTGQPLMPPNGVQQEITPPYDISNQ